MNPYMAYEAVNTKITTKKGYIFDEDKLEKIMECTTVDQVAEFLKSRYGLKRFLDETKSMDLHRDDVETLLFRYEVSEIESLLHYFSGPYKDFIQVFLMEFEISDLVLILRKIAENKDANDADRHFIHSVNFSHIQFSKLAASRSVQQFIENLKGTLYYNPLKTVTVIDVAKRGFHIEMKLEILLYETLMKKAEKLDADDRKTVQEIIGTKIDLLNVQWIYRARKFYGLSPEQILIYVLQGGNRLGYERLKSLCYTRDADEIIQLANKFLRYSIFTAGDESNIERNIGYYFYEYVNDRKFDKGIGSVLIYIFSLDIMIRDLITITEGIRYKLPNDKLKHYLVHSNRVEVKL